MAERVVVDVDKAQQLGDRLVSVGRSIEGLPPGPQPRGPLGSGVLERALSEFERSFARARQDLAGSVNDSAGGFARLASGSIRSDQQQAQQAREIRTT